MRNTVLLFTADIREGTAVSQWLEKWVIAKSLLSRWIGQDMPFAGSPEKASLTARPDKIKRTGKAGRPLFHGDTVQIMQELHIVGGGDATWTRKAG